MSDSRPPPAPSSVREPPPGGGHSGGSAPRTFNTPPLGRPPTHPSGIVPSPILPAAPASQPRPPMPAMPGPGMGPPPPVPSPSPPGPYGPAPTLQGAPPPPGLNPYQSQIIPPTPGYAHAHPPYPPTATPQHGVPIPTAQVPPHKPERGTLPAIQVGVTPAMPSVGVPPASPSRGATSGTIPAVPPRPPAFQTPNVALPRIMVQYPQVGSKLPGARGTYEVRDVIGAGEFGAVYECIGPFDQIYAVKMVRPSNRPYSEVHAEWAKEVQRLFSLRHPNVVYIYDSFTHDHLFYLALERCDHALKMMLGTPMQEGLVLEISRQLLAAVQFLHDNDVVHDDLHPGNVLITHTDRPTVKISDFGISHELRGMAAVRPNVVHHAIMAPEILATGYTSRQSDLYQVGLLLYWMLTGESAMQMDVPYQELVRQVSEGEPRQRAEQLGTPLGQLIAKMLRRREAFRYTSAREVWADLRELPAWKQRHLFPAK